MRWWMGHGSRPATSWCVLTQRSSTVAFWVPEEGVPGSLFLPFCIDNRSLCFTVLQARGSRWKWRQGGYLSTWLQLVLHCRSPSRGLSSGHTGRSGEARTRIFLVSLPLLIKTPVITHHNTLLASFNLITPLNTLFPSIVTLGARASIYKGYFRSEHGSPFGKNFGIVI